jgi:hypothetical protein
VVLLQNLALGIKTNRIKPKKQENKNTNALRKNNKTTEKHARLSAVKSIFANFPKRRVISKKHKFYFVSQ